MEDVILKAWLKTLVTFVDMGAFADALEELTGRRSNPGRLSSRQRPGKSHQDANATYDELAGPPAARPRPVSPSQPVQQKSKASRWLGLAGAAVVGLALLGGVVLPAIERGQVQATAQAEAAAAQATADRGTTIAAAGTATPSNTAIPNKPATPNATPTPALVIGSTDCAKKTYGRCMSRRDFLMDQGGDSNTMMMNFPQTHLYDAIGSINTKSPMRSTGCVRKMVNVTTQQYKLL